MPRSLKILLVSRLHRAEIRGSLVATHGLARELRDRGHDVTLLHAARPEHRIALEGIRVEYVSNMHKSTYPLLFAARKLSDYDVIHTNDESGAFFALRSRMQALPMVAQLQPPKIRRDSFWGANWRWRYMGLSVKYAPAVLTPSHWLGDALVERYGIPAERVHAIPYGIGEHWFAPPTGTRESFASGPRIVLVNMKEVDVALRAFARVAAGFDAELELFGVHKDTPAYRKLAAELGVSERVHFRGFVANEELPGWLAGAQLLLHTATSESFGQVLAEAAALGIPAVASRTNAIPEVVADGERGLLCPVGDVEAFAVALRQLLASPELRQRMGAQAQVHARETWRWSRVTSRVLDEVYAPLMERQRVR